MKLVFHLKMLKPKSSQSNGCTKQAENFEQMLPACHKADGNCFLGQEMSADGGIHATGATVWQKFIAKY
jgi:hypothetical protein